VAQQTFGFKGQYVTQNKQNVHKCVQKVRKQPVVVLGTQWTVYVR